MRHAEARVVSIHAEIESDALRIVLEDDGCGFVLSSDSAQGDGLRNMRQRMEAVGGQFHLESKLGAGTRLEIRVALGRATSEQA